MIDFHTHVLPNVDDGSKSVEETFNLMKEAENAGFDKIISTSHYMEDYYEVENREREVWINAINEKLIEQNTNIKLFLGNEIYITDNIISLLEEEKAATINNTNYVLFEMPLNVKPMNLYDMIFEMLRYKLVPVLAHPERYSFIHKDPDLVFDLMQKGVLMQANFGSIIGQYGVSAEIIVKKMLQNDMVQFLGTDVHKQGTVYAKMPEIMSELRKIIDEEKIKELTTINPELVLNNKKIETSEPCHLKLSLKEKMKMSLKSR